MNGVQLSIFDPPEDFLREALRSGYHEGGRVRIFAALTAREKPVPEDRWLAREYAGTCGFSGHSTRHGFVNYYMRCLEYRDRSGKTHTYSWRQACAKIREMIEEGEFLTREEERQIDHIMIEFGELPFPEACYRYPPEKTLVKESKR